MPKSIMDLNAGDCRFMVASDSYCAEKAMAGTSWCREHRAIVFAASGERPRSKSPFFLPVERLPAPEPVDEIDPAPEAPADVAEVIGG